MVVSRQHSRVSWLADSSLWRECMSTKRTFANIFARVFRSSCLLRQRTLFTDCTEKTSSRRSSGSIAGPSFLRGTRNLAAADGPLTSGGHCGHRRRYLVYHSTQPSLLSGTQWYRGLATSMAEVARVLLCVAGEAKSVDPEVLHRARYRQGTSWRRSGTTHSTLKFEVRG